MIKAQSKKKNTKKTFLQMKPFKILRVVIFMSFFLTRAKQNNFYKIELAAGGDLDCSNNKKTFLFPIHMSGAHPLKPNSIKIKDTAISESRKFIKDKSENKRYGLFEFGEACHYHDRSNPRNVFPFFILIIQNNGKTERENSCQVVGFITNLDLQPCIVSQPTEDLLEKMSITDPKEFNHVVAPRLDHQFRFFQMKHYIVSDLALNDIAENLVEMAIVQILQKSTVTENPMPFLNKYVEKINSELNWNTFAEEIKIPQLLQRGVQDDLPGYFLGSNGGPADDSSQFLQILTVPSFHSFSLHAEFYIAKPQEMELGQKHSIIVKARGWKNNGIDVHKKYIVYIIEMIRSSTNTFNFKVKRNGGTVAKFFTEFGANLQNFIYFALTSGAGILYFNGETNIGISNHEIFHIFQVAQPPVRKHNSYYSEEDTGILYGAYTVNNYVRVDYYPPTGVQENDGGIRVLNLAEFTYGIYPPFLVTQVENNYQQTRCYFEGHSPETCYAYALLSSASEEQSPTTPFSSKIPEDTDNELKVGCKVIYSNRFCITPKPGYMIDLNFSEKTYLRFFGTNLMKVEDFQALNPAVKAGFNEFTNNLGRKYIARCGYPCKNFLILILIRFC